MTFADRLRSMFPWGVESGIRAVVSTLLCGVGLIVTWYAVAGEGLWQRQVGWLSAGIVIVMVTLYAETALVIRGRRAVGERRARLISDALLDLEPVPSSEHGLIGASDIDEGTVTDVVVVAGMAMFHMAGCPLAVGRDVIGVASREAEARGFEQCGICKHLAPSTMDIGDGSVVG